MAVDTAHVCPDCQVALESLDVRERTVTEVVPARVKKGVYQLTRRRCPQCRRVYAAQAPGVKKRTGFIIGRTTVRFPQTTALPSANCDAW